MTRSIAQVVGIVLIALAAMLPGLVCAQPRVALVVGVSAYQAVSPLPNPVNDARDVAAALARLGFETETVLDPDRPMLEGAIRRFGARARGADAALFFYAGHALEALGRNWLLPRTADISSDRDLRFEALDADSVLEQVEGAARVTIVLLDACRDNPFRARLSTGTRSTSTQGLAPVRAAVGTLIGYSTAPGTVAEDGRGRNSPFTGGLLRHIEKPGLELRQMMSEVRRDVREATQGRQVPWEHSSLEGAFYFRPPATPTSPPSAPRVTAADPDSLFWDSIRNSRDPADFLAYLSRFPQGVFADLARNRVVQLGATPQGQASATSQAPTIAAPNPVAPVPAAPSLAAPISPASPNQRRPTVEEMAAAIPLVPREEAKRVAAGYLAETRPRALVVNPERRISVRIWKDSAEGVEDAALEMCQFIHRSPCATVAVDDDMRPWPAGADPPTRAMPRLAYAGAFYPDHVPFVTAAHRRTRDPRDYAAAAGPKAMAIHPWGRLYIDTEAPTQRDAEERALRRCNDEPARAGRDGPCVLYAIAGRVVLPERLTNPHSLITSPQPKRPVPPPLTADALAAAIPFVPRPLSVRLIEEYLAAPSPKVLTVNPNRREMYRTWNYRASDGVEESALEKCQYFFNSPCVLVAVDAEIRAPAAGADWARHDMPRLAYAGRYDPNQVPATNSWFRRQTTLLQDYGNARDPKAMAIHPGWGTIHVDWGAATRAEAERRVLVKCNEYPERAGRDGPCMLYASGDRVVLLERRTTAAP